MESNDQVSIISTSKFFILDFAVEVAKMNKLSSLIIAYPKFKIKNYQIDKERLKCFPYVHGILMFFSGSFGRFPVALQNFLWSLDVKIFSLYAQKVTKYSSFIVSMSGIGMNKYTKKRGQKLVIFRSSRHIVEQLEILKNESQKLGVKIPLPSRSSVKLELSEYNVADKIIVASQICKESFLRQGIDSEKVSVLRFPYELTGYEPESKKIFTKIGRAHV